MAAGVAAVIFEYFTSSDYQDPDYGQAFLIGMLLYLGASLCIALINLVGNLSYIWLLAGDDYVEAVLGDMRRADVPPPDAFHVKRGSYLAEIVDDDRYTTEARIKAATIFTAHKVLAQKAGLVNGTALETAIDKAVLRYGEETPFRERDFLSK